MGRADRLKEVYEYVRKRFPIHTQTDFADRLKYNRAYISSAMHGNEKNLTDKLFTNICEAFPGFFNLEYLLTGEGKMLISRKTDDVEPVESSVSFDPMKELVNELRERIADKDKQIAMLNQYIDDLRRQVYALQHTNPQGDYPFPMGVADDRHPRTEEV